MGSAFVHLHLLSFQYARFNCQTEMPTVLVFLHEQTVTQESPSFAVVFTPWYKQTGLKHNSRCLHLITFCWPSTGIPVRFWTDERKTRHLVCSLQTSLWIHQILFAKGNMHSYLFETKSLILQYVLIAAVKVTRRYDDPHGTDCNLKVVSVTSDNLLE